MKCGTSPSTHIKNPSVCQDKKKRERQKKKEYRLFDDRLRDIHIGNVKTLRRRGLVMEARHTKERSAQRSPEPQAWRNQEMYGFCWCRRSESNRHDRKGRRILSPLRLPVSPLRHGQGQSIGKGIFLVNRIVRLFSSPLPMGVTCVTIFICICLDTKERYHYRFRQFFTHRINLYLKG